MEYDTFPYATMHAVYPSTDPLMDTDLKFSNLSTHEPNQWYSHSFSHFSMPPTGSQFFMNHTLGGHQPDEVTTPIPALAPATLLRQGTPPSEHPSSVSGGALSPGSSDHAPSTPPDETTYSLHHQYDTWSYQTQSQMVQMTGMSDGVKLGDVNPLEDECFLGLSEEKATEILPRSYTMSSTGSNFEMDQMGLNRQASPTDLTPADVKEEISIPNSYPPPEPEDDDNNSNSNTSMDEIEATPQPIQDDDDDQDYKPKASSQRRGSGTKRNPRGRKRSSASQPAQQPKRIKTDPRNLSNKNRLVDQPVIPGSMPSYPCPECSDVAFKDEIGLQNHVKKQHTRPFICVFAFAGCTSTFAAKNEWKRHVASQHLLLFYWLCDQDSCTKLSNSSSSSSRPSHSHSLPNGAIFNRKDLYTQHVRRMHVPTSIKKQFKQKNTVPEWEDRVQVLQKEAHKPRCSLPDYMTCPAPGCTQVFNGPAAWDERMEHVAKHLEKAASGLEERIVFGGNNDPTLTTWAARPDVAVIMADRNRGWSLNNPLKPEKNSRAPARQFEDDDDDEDEDEDAEGEEVDE